MSQAVKVLVLGYGSAGRRHVAHLLSLGARVAVYDPALVGRAVEMPADTRPAPPPRVFWDEGDAMRWGADAVLIATPAQDHLRALARVVAASFRHVFVEKPLALAAFEFDGLDELCVQVGYQLRSHPGCRALKDAVDAGAVGSVQSARFYTGSHISTWGGSSYADALLECSHELDAARWVMGEAEVAGAACHPREATWEVVLRHAGGPLSSVHMSTVEHLYSRRWCVVGTGGVATWDSAEALTTVERVGGAVETVWQGESMEAANRQAYRAQLEAFLSAARAGATPPCSLEDGLAALRLCDRARTLSTARFPGQTN